MASHRSRSGRARLLAMVIVFTIVITGYYVHRANREFDTLSDAIAKELQK